MYVCSSISLACTSKRSKRIYNNQSRKSTSKSLCIHYTVWVNYKSICIFSEIVEPNMYIVLLRLNWLSCESNHLLCGWSTSCTCLGETTNESQSLRFALRCASFPDTVSACDCVNLHSAYFWGGIKCVCVCAMLMVNVVGIMLSNQSNRRQHMVATHTAHPFFFVSTLIVAANRICRFSNGNVSLGWKEFRKISTESCVYYIWCSITEIQRNIKWQTAKKLFALNFCNKKNPNAFNEATCTWKKWQRNSSSLRK